MRVTRAQPVSAKQQRDGAPARPKRPPAGEAQGELFKQLLREKGVKL